MTFGSDKSLCSCHQFCRCKTAVEQQLLHSKNLIPNL